MGIVEILLLPHVVAGGLGIVSGFIALAAAKGAKVHRSSGKVFVYAMLTLSATGAVMALTVRPNAGNAMAGVLTFYLVFTAVLTVRRPARGARWLDVLAMAVGIGGGITGVLLGFDALSRGGVRQGIPAPVFFTFGSVGLLASIGDARMIRAGGLDGRSRLARHLWRMCLGLVIASASFFLGPRGRVPDIIYIPALLPVPVLVPLVAMVFWLWRVRVKGFVFTLGIGPKERTS
jgi:uncharacterized membrane protein